MTLPPEAVRAVLDATQARARSQPYVTVTTSLPGRKRLSCTFAPDQSYNRQHAPMEGLEGLEFWYAIFRPETWTRDKAAGHIDPSWCGWRGCLETTALYYLQGDETRPAPARPRLTFISLFSGIGGFDLGLERAGWECVAQAENDPFCNAVLAKHWPGVRRYGDVRDVTLASATREQQQWGAGLREPLREERAGQTGRDSAAAESAERGGWQGRRGTVDLICGGFPCQDLSVAGKRAGLDGARSGLWFEFHRILSELRPTFCLIENVPGLLSSNSGRDFGIVLGGLGELWPAVGWCVLDSQHFGVPQRRRRIYIVGGPSRASVQQILSLCEGGDWNTQARRAAGEDVAPTLRAGANSTGGDRPPGTDVDTVETLVLAHSLRADGFDASEDGTGRGTPLVAATLRSASDSPAAHNKLNGDDVGTLLPQAHGARRLTPVECERLQGFPDDWTKLDDKTPDGPRYKACGNAVTVPVIEYIGRRIAEVLTPPAPAVTVDEEEPTQTQPIDGTDTNRRSTSPWAVTDHAGRVSRVVVAARTQAQREAARANLSAPEARYSHGSERLG